LVSGFNVEYSGVGFAIIFMAEYGFIFFLRYLTVVIFLWNRKILIFEVIIIRIFIILVRGSFPRFRYDKLIYLAWKGILPVILFLLIFVGGIIIYLS